MMGVMRWILIVIASASVASAQTDSFAADARAAHDAAAQGNCDFALSIGARIKQENGEYYARVFVTDPAIATCLAAPRQAAPLAPPGMVAPTTPIADAPPHQGTPPLSAGRLAGEFLVGGLFAVGGGI